MENFTIQELYNLQANPGGFDYQKKKKKERKKKEIFHCTTTLIKIYV
jgi:hypothetical protein